MYCQRSLLYGATTSPRIIILFCFFALLPVQCTVCVSPMLCLHYCQCCVCKSCVVFVLLPAQCAVCVSPVLCLLNVLPMQFAVRGLRQVLLLLFNLAIFNYFYPFPLVGSG